MLTELTTRDQSKNINEKGNTEPKKSTENSESVKMLMLREQILATIYNAVTATRSQFSGRHSSTEHLNQDHTYQRHPPLSHYQSLLETSL